MHVYLRAAAAIVTDTVVCARLQRAVSLRRRVGGVRPAAVTTHAVWLVVVTDDAVAVSVTVDVIVGAESVCREKCGRDKCKEGSR